MINASQVLVGLMGEIPNRICCMLQASSVFLDSSGLIKVADYSIGKRLVHGLKLSRTLASSYD